MNQLDNGKRITLTSKPSNLLSNEKISLSASTPSISTTIDSSKLLISPTSLNSPTLVSSRSLPSSPLTHTPISSGVVPLSSTHINDKIVVSTSSESESNSVQSELVSEPTQAKTQVRRPLVSYEEEDSKGSSPEPQSVASNSVKEEVQEETLEEKVEEEATSLSEADCASSAAPLDAAVEDQKPSTSSASSADPSSAEQSQKPKTKRVRISLKLDQLSVLRLERLATENPKLLRKLGLKAYRINNFNGSSKRFQIIRVPNLVPRPSESSITQSQLRGLRRPSRAPSSSSIGPLFPTQSPVPRFRAPYPHQRNISAFEYPKSSPSLTPAAYPMDRTQQIQPQQFQYPAQYSQQPQPQSQQFPQQAVQRPVPSSMPPQQQQPPQQTQQQVRPTHIQEPGSSNNCSDSPLLVNLLSNNSQQPQQQPMQPQQIRYPVAQQPQPMTQQHQMMAGQHPGYTPQQMQQNMHMMQQQQYGYPPQRMPGQHPMGPGQMQQIGGQTHMMQSQGIPPQQMQPQQPVPQEAPAPKKRKRPAKKTKKDEEQAKVVAAEEQRRMLQQQHQQLPEYYMMQQRMGQPVAMQRMPPNYPGYPGYPQGQQPSTSMMPPGYPQHGYPPQQQQMWQPNPQEYASQYPMPIMRPTGQQQNPGTPTSGYPPPHQSPGYPQNPASQQQKVRTPSYPQPSPQYPGQNPQQQALNRQFMSPPNHPSPGYQPPPQQNQFVYPQGTQPSQQQQQAAMQQNRQGQQIQTQQQNTPQQNTSGSLEEYGNFNDYNGASLEDLAATFGDLTGDECDLDSITPMNTDQMIPHHQQQPQQMMQANQQGIMHQQPPHNPQQQQQQIASYEQHQFVTPHAPPHQQSPMGYHPSQGYPQMTPHNQQDVPSHFQRPPSAGHPGHMQMYMHHQQVQQQHHQLQQQPPQQQSQQQQQQQPQQHHPQQKSNPKNEKPPNGSNNDGYTTEFDSDIKSPPKANQATQQNIINSIDFVLNKVRKNENEYFDIMTTQWNNNGNNPAPAPASKRKSKSTSSRPPSRQPKNSQPSSAAATPTSASGPFFGNNSTGTEPSTPIKEEPMDFKQERKNSTLSSLLSGSSTPTTMKCEENGHSEISATSMAAIVKTESRDTETPQSVTSGNTDTEHTVASISPNNPPQTDAGVSKVEGNGNHGPLFNGLPTSASPDIASNDAVALKTIQETFLDNNTSTAADMSNAQMPPPPRKKIRTESSPNQVEEYFTGETDISTATTS